MRLSVALCTYNGERHLPEQLKSIAAQNRRPDELVVCDDVSSDRSVEIVKAYAAGCPVPVHVSVNRENVGSSRNFERAIAACRGDVIALADQDDVWDPSKLERFMRRFEDEPELDVLFSNAEIVDEDMRSTGTRLWDAVGFGRREQAAFGAGDAFRVLLKHNVVTGAAMAFRSRLVPRILPVSPLWVHDGWIALIAAATGRVGFISAPLIRYRRHATQQVGAGGNPFRKRLNVALSMDRDCFLRMAEAYRQARDRVSDTSGGQTRSDVLSGFEGKIRHLEFRANLPAGRLSRVPAVLVEVARLRYRRYTEQGGLIGPLQDLIRPR